MVRNAFAPLCCSLVLLVSGCVSFDQSNYPAEWASVSEGSCDLIEGRYDSQAAAATYNHPQSRHLLPLTLLAGETRLDLITSVSLELPGDGHLTVSGYAPGGAVLVRQHYRERDGVFDCYDGWLIFRPEKVPGVRKAPDNPVVGISWHDVALQRAEDGALIMHDTGGAVGLAFLVFPVAARTGEWYRFEPTVPISVERSANSKGPGS